MLAAMQVGKSYVNCRLDIALPRNLPWHPGSESWASFA
jgi:hypothetical protein